MTNAPLVISHDPILDDYYWSYHDGTEFKINAAGTTIQVDWPREETLENMATYLLGPVLGFVAWLHGYVCLHASVIEVDQRAILIVAPSGHGKSTTAALFAKEGYPVMSDDVAAIAQRENSFVVESGYPRLRLWGRSVEMLYGCEDALPKILDRTQYWQDWDKRFLNLQDDGFHFQPRTRPISAIYLIVDHQDDLDQHLIETLPPSAAVMGLMKNLYASRALTKAMSILAFGVLAGLAEQSHIRKLTIATQLANPAQICYDILEDIKTA